MSVTISSLSLEYVKVQVVASKNGVTVNPTGDTVQMAFTAQNAVPSNGDWNTASWEIDVSGNITSYLARCLVGPSGAIELSSGIYDIWVKITDSPEVPVLRAGTLVVT